MTALVLFFVALAVLLGAETFCQMADHTDGIDNAFWQQHHKNYGNAHPFRK